MYTACCLKTLRPRRKTAEHERCSNSPDHRYRTYIHLDFLALEVRRHTLYSITWQVFLLCLSGKYDHQTSTAINKWHTQPRDCSVDPENLDQRELFVMWLNCRFDKYMEYIEIQNMSPNCHKLWNQKCQWRSTTFRPNCVMASCDGQILAILTSCHCFKCICILYSLELTAKPRVG